MNLYTPSCHGNYPPVPQTTANAHDHPPQRTALYEAAMHTLEQPLPPSVREILGAYRMKGEGDREMLLAILQAKTAEDQRIAATTKLHQTLLQISCAPPADDFAPHGPPRSLHIHHEPVQRPVLHPKHPKHPKGNDAPSPAPAARPPSSSSSLFGYNAHATSRRSPEERPPSNGWTTAVLSPSSGAESVGEDVGVTYQSPRSVKDDVNPIRQSHSHSHSHSHSPTDSPLESRQLRTASGDRVMSIGTLLSAREPSNPPSNERRGVGGHRMDVDEEEQARRGRMYDER